MKLPKLNIFLSVMWTTIATGLLKGFDAALVTPLIFIFFYSFVFGVICDNGDIYD